MQPFFQNQASKLCESLNALSNLFSETLGLGVSFFFFKLEKLLLENGERGILVAMGSVSAHPLKGGKHGLWLIRGVPA